MCHRDQRRSSADSGGSKAPIEESTGCVCDPVECDTSIEDEPLFLWRRLSGKMNGPQ